jgi:hypothetical protein
MRTRHIQDLERQLARTRAAYMAARLELELEKERVRDQADARWTARARAAAIRERREHGTPRRPRLVTRVV